MSRAVCMLGLALACAGPATSEPAGGAVEPEGRSSTASVPATAESEPPRWRDLDVEGNRWFNTGCGVEGSGRLRCWGDLAVPELDVEDARAVAVEFGHVCWIDAAEQVLCVSRSAPGPRVVGPVEAAREIQLDGSRGCVLEADGELRCWDGQGAAEFIASEVARFALLERGGCVLDDLGQLSCWTEIVQGGRRGPSFEPILASPGILDVEAVSEAYSHTLWILDDRGRVRSLPWRADPREQWTDVGRVEGGVGLAVSDNHVCVRRSDGTVLCRGFNQYGQLGDGSSVPSERFVPFGAGEAVAVELSEVQTCIRTPSELLCSGWDSIDEHVQHTLPELEAVSLASHAHTTCAVDGAGAMRCWGSDLSENEPSFGIEQAGRAQALGSGVDGLRGLWTHGPWWVWADAKGAMRQSLWIAKPDWALTRIDHVHATGIDELAGALVACTRSAGDLACAREPDKLIPISGATKVEALALGGLVVCAIDGRGHVRCGAHPDYWEDARLVMERVETRGKARAIATSADTGCVANLDGSVECWSNTRFDEWDEVLDQHVLRNRTDDIRDVGLAEVEALVELFEGRFCSLDRAGGVRCWTPGSNSVEPAPTPELDAPALELVAGDAHACARLDDGRVTCWGSERFGQLGRIPARVALVPRAPEFGL